MGKLLLAMRKFFILFLIFLNGCGSWPFAPKLSYQEKTSKEDYNAYLQSLGKILLKSKGLELVHLSHRSINYLKGIYKHFLKTNKFLLNDKVKPNFYFVKNKKPFYFSLPGGAIFLSTGLLNKYIKSEKLLAGILSHEIIRSNRYLYPKVTTVPVGYLQIKEVLTLLRLPVNAEIEINKWNFFALKRAGYDPSVIASFIQIQNKNELDFIIQHGDFHRISMIEHRYKNFIVRNSIKLLSTLPRERKENSSKNFYILLQEIKKQS